MFISEQFARPKSSHNDYKISTAYANLVLTNLDIHGIAYPSVQTKYHGQNLVLPPNVVDKYLTVEVISVQRLYKNKMKSFLNNVKNCLKPSECLTNINWVDLDSKYVAPIEGIHKSLNLSD